MTQNNTCLFLTHTPCPLWVDWGLCSPSSSFRHSADKDFTIWSTAGGRERKNKAYGKSHLLFLLKTHWKWQMSPILTFHWLKDVRWLSVLLKELRKCSPTIFLERREPWFFGDHTKFPAQCICQLRLLQQNIIDWVAEPTGVCFLTIWRLEVRDQDVSMVDFWLNTFIIAWRQPPSHCVLTWQRETVGVSLSSYKDTSSIRSGLCLTSLYLTFIIPLKTLFPIQSLGGLRLQRLNL